MDDTNPEWDNREKAQKANKTWFFAPFRGYLDRVLCR